MLLTLACSARDRPSRNECAWNDHTRGCPALMSSSQQPVQLLLTPPTVHSPSCAVGQMLRVLRPRCLVVHWPGLGAVWIVVAGRPSCMGLWFLPCRDLVVCPWAGAVCRAHRGRPLSPLPAAWPPAPSPPRPSHLGPCFLPIMVTQGGQDQRPSHPHAYSAPWEMLDQRDTSVKMQKPE